MLSAEASAEPGKWSTSRAAYQRGIMDAMSDKSVHTVVVMSSAQVGKTEFLLNVVGHYVHNDPAPMLLLQPTLEMAEAFSKDRLAPMFRDTPVLRGKIKDPRSRDSGNTLLHKTFPGGHLTMAGANSPSSLASRPVRILLCDEVDRYPPSAGTEGDPVSLASKRTATFWNRKMLLVSTPTVKGSSRIEKAFLETDQRRFYVACPHCDVSDYLKWSNVDFGDDAPRTAAYKCEHCGSIWSDVDRWKAVRASNDWRPTAEGTSGFAGFHLSELNSPWRKISDIVASFLSMKGSRETLKTFINTTLGETWEESGDQADSGEIYNRREKYDAEVPANVAVIVAGIDVQDNRLEAEIIGVGEGEETYSLGYHVLHGDPGRDQVWQQLDKLLDKTYQHEYGSTLRVAAACIDTGGHHTHQVYKYCKPRMMRRIYPIKGVGGAGLPIVGRPTKRSGCDLFPIGVDTAKELVYARLQITEPGAGYCHFPISPMHNAEYFAQLTAEKRVPVIKKGFTRYEWVKTRARNEALDCRVYALSALAILNPNYKKISERLAPVIEVEQDDEPVLPAKEQPQAPAVKRNRPMQRKGTGFVRGWNGR